MDEMDEKRNYIYLKYAHGKQTDINIK